MILGVVLINSAIGFVTERQAEKTIASLTKTGVRSVRVLRDGQEVDVSVENIVPGEILLFSPGTYVAADARILQSHRLSVDESALTGESLPVTKDHEFIARDDTAAATDDRSGVSTPAEWLPGSGTIIKAAFAVLAVVSLALLWKNRRP